MRRYGLVILFLVVGYWLLNRKAGASQIDSGGADVGSAFYFSMGKTFMPSETQILSADGLARLKKREGFSREVYADPPGSGKFSIGYGHQLQPGENMTSINEDVASMYLLDDVARAEDAVNSNVSATLSQGAFDALVSFVYNVGVKAFTSGSVPQKLNSGDVHAATNTMLLYNHVNGFADKALAARRADELSQFYA